MKHPHFRHSTVVIAAAFATCCMYGQGQGANHQFCALRFNVSSDIGHAVRSTWVELLDPEGRTVYRKMVVGSSGEICDFGFGPHKLRVGTNECYPTQVENVRLKLGTPIELSVILN